jgi:hypothetical protein
VAAEVTRDRHQKTESAEKEGGKQFWVYEINEDFRLMVRPGHAAFSSRSVNWPQPDVGVSDDDVCC